MKHSNKMDDDFFINGGQFFLDETEIKIFDNTHILLGIQTSSPKKFRDERIIILTPKQLKELSIYLLESLRVFEETNGIIALDKSLRSPLQKNDLE